jgi:hypothetical protein
MADPRLRQRRILPLSPNAAWSERADPTERPAPPHRTARIRVRKPEESRRKVRQGMWPRPGMGNTRRITRPRNPARHRHMAGNHIRRYTKPMQRRIRVPVLRTTASRRSIQPSIRITGSIPTTTNPIITEPGAGR